MAGQAASPSAPAGGADVYARLAAPFETHHTRRQAGVDLTYLTGEQVVSRLNEVLGPAGWTFEVREHGEHSGEVWALGRLTAWLPTPTGEREIVREQFGSQQIKRSSKTGQPLDIGFDLKGATTDALKKCATLIGVGLYLSHKEEQAAAEAQTAAGQTAAPTPINPKDATLEQIKAAYLNRGYKRPSKDEWAQFWATLHDKLGVESSQVVLNVLKVQDADDALFGWNTTLKSLLCILAWHLTDRQGRPLPPYFQKRTAGAAQ